MKLSNTYIIIFMVFIFSLSIYAQEDEKFREKACCNFAEGLKSDIDGIVISAMINVMRMYHDYPDQNFEEVNRNLDTLIVKDSTEQIQFIARIIKDYLNDEADLDWMMDYSNESIHHYLILLSASDVRKIAYGF